MAVRIRMKKMGRRHRPFYRLCAVDARASRDGKVIEYLGYYDPMVRETDARTILKKQRIDYWLSVGAQPSHKAGVLIKKYGTNGTRLDQQQAALERLEALKPKAPAPTKVSTPEPEQRSAEEAGEEKPAASAEDSAPAEQEPSQAAEAAAGEGQEKSE